LIATARRSRSTTSSICRSRYCQPRATAAGSSGVTYSSTPGAVRSTRTQWTSPPPSCVTASRSQPYVTPAKISVGWRGPWPCSQKSPWRRALTMTNAVNRYSHSCRNDHREPKESSALKRALLVPTWRNSVLLVTHLAGKSWHRSSGNRVAFFPRQARKLRPAPCCDCALKSTWGGWIRCTGRTDCSRRSTCPIVAGRSRGRCWVAAFTSGQRLHSRRRQHRRCWSGYIGAGPYVAASRDLTAAIQV
jgi:hypothetical protein